MSAESFEQARQLHLRGDFAGAIALYQQVLESEPKRGEVWHLKGMAEHQSGRLDQALDSASRALAVGGARAPYLLLAGGVLHDRGELAKAEQLSSRAVAAQPRWAPALIERGAVRLDQERLQEALDDFRAATEADPKNARAWNNLGVTLQAMNRLDDAFRAYNHTLTINPSYALAHFNVARIYRMRNDLKTALHHAQAATQVDSKYGEAWLLVGDIQRRVRQPQAAIEAYKAAAAAMPGNVTALNALADLLAETGRFEDARRGYWSIWQKHPQDAKSALGANLLLPQIYASTIHLEIVRREYAEGLERLHQSAGAIRFAGPEAALRDTRWTNFYLAYQGRNDRDLQRRYGELHRKLLEPAVPEFFRPRAKRSGGERLRVGFLSHFFFNCTAGRYFSSWITGLDPKRFEKFLYYTNEWVADDTRTMAAAAQTFRHMPGRTLESIARQVAADHLDVLVYPELGMHADTFTLAGLRLAPVQVAGWGHPTTPGLPNIDWFFSCEAMEPSDAASHYNEKLGLLPGLGTRYALPKTDHASTRNDFLLPADKTLYLVPQSLFKIHPDNDELIARVLSEDPDGVAVLFSATHDGVTQAFGQRLGVAFRKHQVDLQSRAIFIASNLPHASYLRLNQLCDVMIDTLHWSGGNTSLDAIASGLPVVTTPGELMRGRQSAAMLEIVGVPELVAKNPEKLVETAVRLGKDRDERRALSERMTAGRERLFERDEPIRALEDLLEKAFKT